MNTGTDTIRLEITEDEYRILGGLVRDAIVRTPTGAKRNLLTDMNIKMLRNADASRYSDLIRD